MAWTPHVLQAPHGASERTGLAECLVPAPPSLPQGPADPGTGSCAAARAGIAGHRSYARRLQPQPHHEPSRTRRAGDQSGRPASHPVGAGPSSLGPLSPFVAAFDDGRQRRYACEVTGYFGSNFTITWIGSRAAKFTGETSRLPARPGAPATIRNPLLLSSLGSMKSISRLLDVNLRSLS